MKGQAWDGPLLIEIDDAEVTQLRLDYRFTIVLGTDAHIVIEEPFSSPLKTNEFVCGQPRSCMCTVLH